MNDLRSLALAATPGPWRVYGPWPKATVYVDDDSEADDSIVPTWVADCGECDPHAGQLDCAQHPNAAFIAACSPDRIVQLLDERDEARRIAADLSRQPARLAAATIESLKAQLAAVTAERDAYRRAKQENDERYMIERDTARAEVDRMRAELKDAETYRDSYFRNWSSAESEVDRMRKELDAQYDTDRERIESALKYDERIWRAYLVLKTIHRDGLIEALRTALTAQREEQ